jgi:hypothetical protein
MTGRAKSLSFRFFGFLMVFPAAAAPR